MRARTFATGKLPTALLARLLQRAPLRDARVLVGPRVGVDAAVIDCGRTCLVLKSDPITFAADRIGWYAVHINANDVAAMGARPRWFLATVLLPERAASELRVRRIFRDLASACRELDISLCGGHTEVTAGLDRPILCGHLVGEVTRSKLILPDRARRGDSILLARGIAIEGTAVAARERRDAVRKALGERMARRCRSLLDRPGISVVRAALAAGAAAELHAMHDPTEGGLAMGLFELAQAANVGMEVDRKAIPIYPETAALCEAFSLDPLRLLASGSLLIVCAPSEASAVERALRRQQVPVARIGTVRRRDHGVVVRGPSRAERIRRFAVDEITKLLA